MKRLFLISALGFIFTTASYAEDANEVYFIAYNASQANKLPEVLKKQMQSTVMLDQIAVDTLKKMGQMQLSAEYYNRPDLQNKLRPLVQNYITSKNGTALFDDAGTKLFSTIYTVDELKALYQNNKSTEGQKFLNASIDVDLATQEFINTSYKQKFDQQSVDQLEVDIEKIFIKYHLKFDTVSPEQSPEIIPAQQADTVAATPSTEQLDMPATTIKITTRNVQAKTEEAPANASESPSISADSTPVVESSVDSETSETPAPIVSGTDVKTAGSAETQQKVTVENVSATTAVIDPLAASDQVKQSEKSEQTQATQDVEAEVQKNTAQPDE